MDYWEGPARWINTILLIIVAFIGFDTLFRLLNANEENVIVGTVAAVAGVFLAPFEGMFPDQEFLLTAIIAVLGYSLLAGIALAVTRSVAASRRARARRRSENPGAGSAAPEAPQPSPGVRADAETTRPLGPPPAEAQGAAEDSRPRVARDGGPKPGQGSGRKATRDGGSNPPEGSGPKTAEDADATQPTPRGKRNRDGTEPTQTDRTQRLS